MQNLNEIVFFIRKFSTTQQRDAEIALLLIKGDKYSSLAEKYKCSKTTIKNAYIRSCRNMYRSIQRSQIFTQDELDELHNTGFKCKNGILITEKYIEYLSLNKNLKIQNNKWIESSDEIKSFHNIIENKINTLINVFEKKKEIQIKKSNDEFETIKRILSKLLIDIKK